MKLSKCELWMKEVSFLGHMISSGGFPMDPSKIDNVLQLETLKFVTEIRSFLVWLVIIEGSSKAFQSWNCL